MNPARVRHRTLAREHFFAAGFFTVLLLIFFGPALIHTHTVYSPADFSQTRPIEQLKDGFYPLANSIQSDPPTQNVPWMIFDREEIRAGHLPTWNPYNAGGVPELGDDQSAVFSPFSVPFYVLPLRLAFVAAAFMKLFLLSFCTWGFLRRRGLGWGAGLVGGTVFPFAGYQILWLSWAHIGSTTMLPVCAWAAEIFVQERGRRRGLGFAGVTLGVTLGIVAGHPETGFYCGLALVPTLLLTALGDPGRREWLRSLAQLAGACVLGAVIAAAQLLPFLEYTHNSTTYANRSAVAQLAGVPLGATGMLAFPDAIGNAAVGSWSQSHYIYAVNTNEGNGDYVGFIAIVLAVVGLLALRQRRIRGTGWLAAGLLAFGFLSWHVPWISAHIESLPLLKLGSLNRAHDIWDWGVALGAALGVETLLSASLVLSLRRRLLGAGGFVLGSGLALLGAFLLAEHSRDLQRLQPDSVVDVAKNVHFWHEHVLAVVLFAAVGVLAGVGILLARGRLRGLSLATAAIAVFLSTGLLWQGNNPVVPTSVFYPNTPAMQLSAGFSGDDPVLRVGLATLLPNMNLPYRTDSVEVVDALGVKWYDDLFAKALNVLDPSYVSEGMPECVEQLQLFGIRWVVGSGRVAIPVGTHTSDALDPTRRSGPDLAKLPRVGVSGHISVFEVPGSTGVATVAGTTTYAADGAAAIDQVAGCSFDSNHAAVLIRSGLGSSSRPAPAATSGGVASEGTLTPGGDTVTTTGGGGEMVLRRTWYPGWKATVDGRSAPVDRVDGAFIGVPVPAGDHTVKLSYRPTSLRNGFAVSALGILVLLGVLAGPGLRRRFRPAPVPEPVATVETR